jgi:hypothetical protein
MTDINSAAPSDSSAPPPSATGDDYTYDVALSFAGEDRDYVERVARALDALGIRHFYDFDERVKLWGKDLYEHLTDVYNRDARFMVMFISAHYAKKKWTRVERRAGQAREFENATEYILPARFDDTTIPGVLPTVAYINLAELTPEQFAEMIAAKVRGTKVVYGDGKTPSGIAPEQKRAASALLAKVQGQSVPLAQCVAEALTIAQAIGDDEFETFCAYELGGWPRDSRPLLAQAEYRTVRSYSSLDALNPNFIGWGNHASRLLDYLRENPDQFKYTPTAFALPVAELERRAREPMTVSSVITTTQRLGDNNPDAKYPDTPVYVYMAAASFARIVDGIRAELTRRLLRVARAK